MLKAPDHLWRPSPAALASRLMSHQHNAAAGSRPFSGTASNQQQRQSAGGSHPTAPANQPAATGAQAGAGTRQAGAAAAPTPVPLKMVVREAVQRWFDDALTEAQRGDIKQQALVGQMYAEGYGCELNLQAARHWTDKARERGFKMQGVYDEL